MVGPFRKNYVAILLMLIVGGMFAGSDEEFFLRGNKYYEQKDYDNAFRSYDMMSKKGRAVLYNMGNTCFYQGDYAQALVYWSRAEVGATSQEYNAIARNKAHVFSIMGKQEDQSLQYRLTKRLDEILPYVSLFFLQLFFLLCWYIFALLMRNKQMKIKKMVLSALLFFMVISGGVLGVHYTHHATQSGIVVKKEAQLFTAPDKNFHPLCPVVYAHDVVVKEKREGWYKIRYTDMIGWVEADVVQII